MTIDVPQTTRPPADRSSKKAGATALFSVMLLLVVWGVWRRSAAPASGPQDHPETAAAAVSGPNVLLISIDMLRADHVHCYRYQRQTTPHIDQLAAEGVLFENHISSTSWTLPAHAAMFTGLADSVHGCTDTDRRLPDKLVTLAERFAAAGYRTVGFYSGPFLHPAFGLGQGFEHYQNCTSYAKLLDESPPEQWNADKTVERSSHADVTNPIVYAAVKDWLTAHHQSRFFMFVHMWDPHFDFIPPPPYDTMWDPDYHGSIDGRNFFHNKDINAALPARDIEHLIALYDGEITCTDEYVGRIIDELRNYGVLDKTVVVVTADHGTEFFEHGDKGHRKTLFDEVLRIPLILRYPDKLPAGRRVAAQTRMIDLAPTLLELAGLPAAPDMMGHSLVALATSGTRDFDNTAVSELFSVRRELRALRTIQWKYIHDLARKQQYYYRLLDDPRELYPESDFNSPLGLNLQSLYERAVSNLDDWRQRVLAGQQPASIPNGVRRQLESLGYVGDKEHEE